MSELKSERLLTGKFILLLAAAFGVFLANGIITPVLPVFVKDDLGGGDVAVGVVVAVQAISAIAIRPWLTPKFNEWGVKPILIGSIVASGLSFALSGFVPNVFCLIILRLFFGAGMAALFIGALTAVTSLVSPVRSGEAISLFSVAPYLSMGIGPIVGQAIFHAYGYIPTFLLAGGVALLGVIPILFYKAMPVEPLPEVEGVTLKRFYKPAVWPGVVIALGIVGMLSFGAFMPLFALQIPGLEIQICFLILSVAVLLMRTLGSRLPDRMGPKKTGIFSTTALIIGMAGLATTMGPYWAYLAILPFAIGQALQYPGLLSLTLDGISEHDRPVAISTFTLFFDLSQGFGGLIVGVIAAIGGYRSVFAAAAVAAFIGLMILLAIVIPRYEAARKARTIVTA
ncbi:MAG: MFS transporter [Actinomycetota bacterium]|nr:MFS transporter [Actinomycetota bacterium]